MKSFSLIAFTLHTLALAAPQQRPGASSTPTPVRLNAPSNSASWPIPTKPKTVSLRGDRAPMAAKRPDATILPYSAAKPDATILPYPQDNNNKETGVLHVLPVFTHTAKLRADATIMPVGPLKGPAESGLAHILPFTQSRKAEATIMPYTQSRKAEATIMPYTQSKKAEATIMPYPQTWKTEASIMPY